MKDSKLEATHKALAEYRSTRKNRKTPIPDTLKKRVISHLNQYSATELADRLGLANCLIYKWKKDKSSEPQKKQAQKPSPFVELAIDQAPLASFSSDHCSAFVEFSRPDGATMRIPMNLQRDNVNSLIANFFGGIYSC